MKFLHSQSMSNKSGLCRVLGAIALVAAFLSLSLNPEPVNGAYVPDTDLGQGILGFLRSLESTMAKKTMWFYRHFGKNVDPIKTLKRVP